MLKTCGTLAAGRPAVDLVVDDQVGEDLVVDDRPGTRLGRGAGHGLAYGAVGGLLTGWASLPFLAVADGWRGAEGFFSDLVVILALGAMFAPFLAVPIGCVVGLVVGAMAGLLRLAHLGPVFGAISAVAVLMILFNDELFVGPPPSVVVLQVLLAMIGAAIGWFVGGRFADRMASPSGPPR